MRYLYHVSRVAYRSGVLEDGLIPGYPTRGPHYAGSACLRDQPCGVYVWPTLACARDWAAWAPGREIWRFPRRGFRCHRDPYFAKSVVCPRALYIVNSVPPGLLQLVETNADL